jgi:uncharacterized lipoprotein NlpE involved in copper resistance
MKKTLFALTTLSLILVGCDSAETTASLNETEPQPTTVATMTTEGQSDTEQVMDPIDAQVNAIAEASKAIINPDQTSQQNWQGTYSGIMPCADCDGVETVLTLNQDETYQLTETYIGKENGVIESTGAVQWDEAGITITLVNDNGADPVKYSLNNDQLTKLDLEGAPLSGDFASLYQLTKQH